MPTGLVNNNDLGFVARATINNNLQSIGVKNFSVVGDGVYNDLSRFLEALEYSVTSGYSISIPSGVNISLGGGTLTIPSGASIDFSGGFISNGTIVGNYTRINAGIEKIFHTNITLQGSFNMNYVCPQHFGAVVNTSLSTLSNSCSTAIQKCLDSPINVYFPQGFYYITSALNITIPKSIEMAGYGIFPDDINGLGQTTIVANHGRVYTDQDINLVNIQSQGVNLKGTFDTSNVTSFTSAVIRYDMNYKMWGGNLDVNLNGNPDDLIDSGFTGKGIYFDQTGLTATQGFAVYIKIRGFIQWYAYGLYIDTDDLARVTYVNSLDIDVNMNGCKQFVYSRSGSQSKYKGVLQTRKILGAGEEDTYCVDIDSGFNFINFFLWDLDQPLNPGTGGIGNSNGILLNGIYNQIGDYSQYFYTIRKLQGGFTTPSMINPASSVISKSMLFDYQTWVSKVDSETVALDKRHTVTVKKFNGTGVDFETALDPTVGAETSFITISDSSQIWRISGLPCGVTFTAGGDLDKDYVEIEITPSSGTFTWSKFFINLYEYLNYFKQVQVIEHYSGGTKVSYLKDRQAVSGTKNTYIFDLPVTTSTKTIIRLIGAQSINNILYIMDIGSARNRVETPPYIHIDGGQRIYGDLTATQYKLSELNAAPASAGAAGVLGDVRVTSDYIYVCTATNTWKRTALTTWP